jgi:hypothetical protein
MTEELSTACVVIVERGVNHLPSLDEPSSTATERAMIAQAPDEAPEDLAVRVIRRATDLARNRTPVERAVIVASDAVDDEVFKSRCRIARALVRAMEGAPRARLLFVPSPTLPDEGRHELLSIVGTLATQLSDLRVEVGVRFAPPAVEVDEPPSQVRLKTSRVVRDLAAEVA